MVVGAQKNVDLREDQDPAQHEHEEEEDVFDALGQQLDDDRQLIVGSEIEEYLLTGEEDDDHVHEGHRKLDLVVGDLADRGLLLVVRDRVRRTLDSKCAIYDLEDCAALFDEIEEALVVLPAVAPELDALLRSNHQLNQEAPIVEADDVHGILRVLLEYQRHQEKNDVEVELKMEDLLRLLVLEVDEVPQYFLSIGVVRGLLAESAEPPRQAVLRRLDHALKVLFAGHSLDVVDLVLQDAGPQVKEITFNEVIPRNEVSFLDLFFHDVLNKLFDGLSQKLVVELLEKDLQLVSTELGHSLHDLLRKVQCILRYVLVDSTLLLLHEVFVERFDLLFSLDDVEAS